MVRDPRRITGGSGRRPGTWLPAHQAETIESFGVHGAGLPHRRPFIWNLLRRAPNRIVAAVLAQPRVPSGDARSVLRHKYEGLGPELVKHRPEITMEMVDKFLTRMY